MQKHIADFEDCVPVKMFVTGDGQFLKPSDEDFERCVWISADGVLFHKKPLRSIPKGSCYFLMQKPKE